MGEGQDKDERLGNGDEGKVCKPSNLQFYAVHNVSVGSSSQ